MVRVCPECGGEMYFDRRRFMYVCRVCGLSLSRFELDKYKDRRRVRKEEEDWRKEYLKWWLSSKK